MRSFSQRLAAALLGGLLCSLASAQTWVEVTPASGAEPTPRKNAASIYDPVAQRMIVFGGKDSGGDVNDVWSFDLAAGTWSELTPSGGAAPSGRFTANAVYDHAAYRMLIWSGQGSGAFLNDVWAFDLSTLSWSEFTPAGSSPNIRYGTAAVFDPLARHLVTFADFTSMGRFDDTWRFDSDADQWTDVTPGSVSPQKRCLHSASYDIPGHRMIMYGGQRSGPLDDIWAFDLTDDSWTELTPASRPDGRYFAAQDYDSARHRTLVFGGSTPSGSTDETWAFDLASNSWAEIEPTGASPVARNSATAVYVVSEDRMIVYGGSGGGLRNDIWSLELAPAGGPPFPWPIMADDAGFSWTVPTNVDWVRGELAGVGSYAVDATGSQTHATSFAASATPGDGSGHWYLVKLGGIGASWQSASGAEPGRDLALP